MALRLSLMGTGTSDKYAGTASRTSGGLPVFTGRINLDYQALELPRTWRLPRIIFVNSMSDLFHENVPLGFIQEVFGVMEECSQHTFQVLTKRPERAMALATDLPWPKNVWMGTSVEDSRVLERVRLRFLSCEPLLGPLSRLPLKGVDWVIVGGESGPGARPMEERWVTQIRRQCETKGVRFFFKQWGGVNKKLSGRTLEGRTWDDRPDPVNPSVQQGAACGAA